MTATQTATASLTSNRVTNAIVSMDANILERIDTGKTTRAEVDATDKALEMDLEEYTTFQRLKSLASMSRVLTLEEAQTIYGYLGNTVEHFNRQTVAVKVVLTRIFSELLAGRIGDAL